MTKKGGATVAVTSSGNSTNTIWFAPTGTTNFVPGSTITTVGGIATTILAPATEGTYVMYVIDAAGNISSASTAILTVDNTPPTLSTVTIISNNASTTLAKVGNTVTLTFISSESIDSPTVSIGAESGGAVTVTQGVDSRHWTAVATMTSGDSNGTVPFTVDFDDLYGNVATQVTAIISGSNVTFDKASPTLSSVSISSNNASTTLAKSGDIVTLSFTSNESISSPTVSFNSSGDAVTGSATVTNTSGNNWTATYVVSSSDSSGVVTFSIGSYHDAVGNNGSSVTSGTGTVRVDVIQPQVMITSGESDPTGNSPFSVDITFTEAVTGLSAGDFIVTNGSAGNLTGSGTTYSVDITPSANGAVTVNMPEGAAADPAGNTNTEATYSITFSSSRPTVMLSTNASSTTNATSFTVTATFSASVSGFTLSDLTGNITNGSASSFSGISTVFSFLVTPTADGTVTINLPAGVAVDSDTGHNNNFAAAPLSVVVDRTAPVLSQVAAVTTPTRNTTPSYTFNSTEAGTLIVGGGCTTNTTSVSSGNNTITFNTLSDGAYSCTIRVRDTALNVSSTLTATSFTVDTVAPEISHVTSDTSNTAATIEWRTDEIGSSQIVYGLTSNYGSLSTESDVVSPVTSHSVVLSNLVSCVTYHFTASSTDPSGNNGFGDDNTFTTKGCAGNASVKSQSAHSITHASGGSTSLISDGTGLSLSVPPAFGHNDAQFQIKHLDKTAALDTTTGLGVPATTQAVGDYVFDLHALTDVETYQSVFDETLTITLNYNSGDVSGLDENSLKIYRNDSNVWTELSNCLVNTSLKSVTCDTEHFSTFAIFGQLAVVTSSPTETSQITQLSSGGGTTFGCADTKALNYSRFVEHRASMCQYATTTVAVSASYKFTRDLKLGMTGNDVKELQKILVAKNTGPSAKALLRVGLGSRFGNFTKAALTEFQTSNKIMPATGNFGPRTRGLVNGH